MAGSTGLRKESSSMAPRPTSPSASSVTVRPAGTIQALKSATVVSTNWVETGTGTAVGVTLPVGGAAVGVDVGVEVAVAGAAVGVGVGEVAFVMLIISSRGEAWALVVLNVTRYWR